MKRGLFFLALVWASVFAHAEHTAPVYDVDSLSNDTQSGTAAAQDARSKSALNQALTSSSEPPATVEQRVAQVEQQLSNIQQSDLSNRLNSMQGEVQALRGQVEELTHQLQTVRSQQGDLHAENGRTENREMTDQQAMSSLPRVSDEDSASASPRASQSTPTAKSLAKTEAPLNRASGNSVERRASTSKLSTKKTVPALEQPNAVEEQAVYQTAYNLIKIKKYDEAIATLQKMLTRYPGGQSAANAHYWLGELYSLTGANERATTEFSVVVKQYPTSPRVADAELKLGLLSAALLKWPAAKASFKKVINQYPGTTSARLAMEQLKLLKQSGH